MKIQMLQLLFALCGAELICRHPEIAENFIGLKEEEEDWTEEDYTFAVRYESLYFVIFLHPLVASLA
jgi:hypothetical protein